MGRFTHGLITLKQRKHEHTVVRLVCDFDCLNFTLYISSSPHGIDCLHFALYSLILKSTYMSLTANRPDVRRLIIRIRPAVLEAYG